MKKRKNVSIKTVFTFLVITLLVITSCENNKDPEAPQLPPESSFAIDFSDFSTDKSLNLTPDTKTNWFWSAVAISYWNLAVTVTMALPVASFYESFNHEAIYEKDGNYWTWTYNVLGSYKAVLKGSIEGDSAVWNMSIDNFEWYNGKSALDRTGGNWKLKKSPVENEYWLNIVWHKSGDDEGNIRYTNIMQSDTMYTSYIEYGMTTTGDYNRYYNLYGADKDNLVNIEWNNPEFNGRVKSSKIPAYSEWQCWDEYQTDIVCPGN